MNLKAFTKYLATGDYTPTMDAAPFSLADHDRRFHPQGFNPDTDTCNVREVLAAGDVPDLALSLEAAERKEKQSASGKAKKLAEELRNDLGVSSLGYYNSGFMLIRDIRNSTYKGRNAVVANFDGVKQFDWVATNNPERIHDVCQKYGVDSLDDLKKKGKEEIEFFYDYFKDVAAEKGLSVERDYDRRFDITTIRILF